MINKGQYLENPTNLDTRTICCNQHKIWTRDAYGMANSVEPDQTVPLSWFYTVCQDLPVWKLRIIMVCSWRSSLIRVYTVWHLPFRMHLLPTLLYRTTSQLDNWASSWDYGTFHKGDQRRLRRVCAVPVHSRSLATAFAVRIHGVWK